MKINKFNSIIIIGLIAIVGILIAQLLWTKEAFSIEEKKFSQKTHIALLEVVKKLYEGTNHELPLENPIKRITNDYYIVNIDNDFEPEILEHYLKKEFNKNQLVTDFEYAVYNCESDEMVYGNYISLSDKAPKKSSVFFPKHRNLVYYFAIRFPSKSTVIISSMKFWFVLSFALIIILLVYVYSIYTIVQQKKYSELQRDFINNMTHEFKTPLSSILIASNYLKKQNAIQNEEKLSHYTQLIINQSNNLNHHIEKILNIAKWNHSALLLDLKEVIVLPVINEVVENIQLKNENAKIKIDCFKEYCIKTDRFHFTNIIHNILDNAIKYCQEKPEISIQIIEENKHLKLSIVDNGIGINPKNIPYLFDKFYRIPDANNYQVSGFGLGLFYVKRICDLHHWKIQIKNKLPNGTIFSILIPV